MLEEIVLEEETIAEERIAEAGRLGAALLNQPLRTVATVRKAVCVPSTVSVRSAIEQMNQNGVGCVLVEEGGQLTGIFTERDVLTKIVGTALDLDHTAVASVMTPDPESLAPDDRVAYALNLMCIGGFRHIPLRDERGHPVGVVSMRNVVDHMVDVFRTEVLNLPPAARSGTQAREGA
jgi:CBS domain-containing protein